MRSSQTRRGGRASNVDPKVKLIRSAMTKAIYKHAMSGLPRKPRREPSLPTVKFLERER